MHFTNESCLHKYYTALYHIIEFHVFSENKREEIQVTWL
jgi:hypothetical protein